MDNEYYGAPTTPTSDYLAHYGVKGMKWGVRKAIQSGSERRLSRQFNKAQKKLAKLEKRANNGAKYARRASRYGAGAALTGGLAIAGTEGVSKGMRFVGKGLNAVGDAARAYGRTPGKGSKFKRVATQAGLKLNQAGKAMVPASEAVSAWGNSTSLGKNAVNGILKSGTRVGHKAGRALKGHGIDKLSNNTIARIGAGAVGAGLAAAAIRNQHKAKTTDKYAKKAAAFRNEMQKSFAGTKYANQVGQPRKKKRR